MGSTQKRGLNARAWFASSSFHGNLPYQEKVCDMTTITDTRQRRESETSKLSGDVTNARVSGGTIPEQTKAEPITDVAVNGSNLENHTACERGATR